MADRLDHLFREWHRLGGAVLLAETVMAMPVRPPEEVIAESTAHCRESGRLTWVVLDWLLQHIDEIDDQTLLQKAREGGDLSVLGVLCDAAYQRRPHPKFERLMSACAPHPEVVPFFLRVARSPLTSRLARENALEVFRRWNYLCSELRYLGEARQPDAVSVQPLFRKIDCLQIPVPDLEAGVRFYRDQLGHELIWRTETSAGLRLPDTDAEIVIQTEREELEVNLLVSSVEAAVERIVEAGGRVVVSPFDIQIGRCAVVQDPWGNRLVLLDMSKGQLATDASGNVVGNAPSAPS